MPDIAHIFGGDLAIDATGDLQTSDSLDLSQQMVLRRLLTNPQDYIWHPQYGAGLPRFIGLPIDKPTIESLIRTQMFQEGSVVQSPAPVIDISPIAAGMFARIQYTENDSGFPANLAFRVEP